MTKVADAFHSQSRGCVKLGSPFMGQLMRVCAERLRLGTAVADRIFAWPGNIRPEGDSVPLRLAGGLHALHRAGHPGLAAVYPPHEANDDELWSAVSDALVTEEAHLLRWLDRPPQTNEVRRAAAVIPALHLLSARFGLPIRLSEVGTSGGLNLVADRFFLRAGETAYGDPASPVHLGPEWDGPAPSHAPVEITSRTGVDLAPIHDDEADRLLAYLWPDQQDRIDRTAAAIALAREAPRTLVTADAADWLESGGFAPIPGALHLLFHTIAWQYLPPNAQACGEAAIAAAGATATPDAPLARFSMEADGDAAALRLQLWPGPVTLDLGRADYHGRRITWRVSRIEEAIA